MLQETFDVQQEVGSLTTSTTNLFPEFKKPSKIRVVLIALVILLVVFSVVFIVLYVKAKNDDSDGTSVQHVVTPCTSSSCVASAADITRNLDTSAKPCEDFYEYSCGGFEKNTFIRNDQSSVDPLTTKRELVNYQLRNLLQDEQLMSNYSKDPNSAVYRAFSFYKSCMSESRIEAAGIQPILKVIKDYGSWTITNKNWTNETWVLEKILARVSADLGVGALISVSVGPEPFNTSKIVPEISGGSTVWGVAGQVDDKHRPISQQQLQAIVSGHLTLMSTVFKLLGANASVPSVLRQEARKILLFEDAFRLLKQNLAQQASIHGYKNILKLMTIAELNNFTSYKFNWTVYLNELIRGTNKSFDLNNQKFLIAIPNDIKNIIDYITGKEKSLLADAIMWNVVYNLINTLPKSFRDANNEYIKLRTGIEVPTPRWQTCVAMTNTVFKYATALLYSNAYLPEDAQERAAELFLEIKNVFIEGLEEQTWMDNATRTEARIKLYAMEQITGYPAFIKNANKLNQIYEKFFVSSFGFFQAVLNARRAIFLNGINQLGKPTDNNRFPSPPVATNAFYSPQTNMMYILLGIMQEPFYNSKRLKALNYGSIGMVIGHEITHGFDDSGSQFDEKGNVRSWWTKTSLDNYENRSRCLVQQYNNTIIFGRKVDGMKTLSENIADNGGLKYAFRAYQKWRDTNGKEDKLPSLGYTNDQLFFIGFAQTWCSKYREESITNLLASDTHSLNPVRVRVPLSNFPEFSKAFGCKLPTKTCTVW